MYTEHLQLISARIVIMNTNRQTHHLQSKCIETFHLNKASSLNRELRGYVGFS